MSSETATPEGEKKRRPILKWSLIVLGVLAGLVLILLLSLRFAAQSEFGRQFVEKRIEAADPSGQDIEIEGLSGDLLGTFRIERLTITDDQGVWLVAEDVLADWKPLALRKRALLVDAFEADLIHMLRRPNLVSNASSGGGSMPLRAGALDRLRISELRTDKGVLPRALSLEINGQGRIAGDGGRTQLSVLPLEGEGDELLADLIWSDDFRLRGTLDLNGPAGGLFAALARLEPGQSLSASLDADGTLDDWAGEATIAVDGETAVEAEAGTEDGVIGFDLTAFPRRHPLSRQVADTLGETITVEGRLLSNDDRQRLLELTANAEGLELDAQAGRPQSGTYSADIRLAIDEPSRYAGRDNISVSSALLDGTLVYDQGAARFEGTLEASDIDVPSFTAETVSGPLNVVYDSPSILVRTTLTGERATLPGMTGKIAGGQPVLKLNGQYALGSRTLSLRETLLTGKAGRVSAAGTMSFSPSFNADMAGSFTVDGAAADLQRPVKLNGQFQANRAGAGRTTFTLSTRASNFGSLPSPLSQWSDGQARLDARGEIQGGGAVRLSSFSLQSGTLQLDGSGRMTSEQRLMAEADLTAGEARLAGMALDSLNGRVSITGPVSDLNFETRLNAPSLGNDSINFSNINLIADGRYGDGTLNTAAELTSETSNNGPITVRTGLIVNGRQWSVSDFQAEWGSLTAEASLRGDGGKLSTIRGELNVNGNLPEGLPAERIVADANIQGERLAIDATLESFAVGPTEADALVFRASGTPENVDFLIEMRGSTELNDLSYETVLDMDGHVEGLTTGRIDLTTSLSALLGDIGLNTEEPLRYTQYEDGFESSARFAALGGTFSPSVTTRGQTSLRLEGEGLRIAPVLLIAGRPALEGVLSIDVDFTETEGGLSGPFNAELAGISQPGSELGPVDLIISGDLQTDQLVTNIRADDNEALDARVDITVPVRTMEAPPFILRQPDTEMPFQARVDGPIDAVSALLVPPQMVLRGLIDLEMSGSLPTLNESFSGELRFAEGEFEHGDLGMVLNQINAAATLGGGSVDLTEFNAAGRSGGTLSGSGTMAVDGSAISDIQIEAKELVVTERKEGRATVSGTMEVRQQPELLEIIGDLTVDKGEVNIDNLPDGGPPTLNVNFEDPIEEDEETEEEEAATRLDIQLNAPGRIDVRGRGANAELSLDADITGSLGNPVITGEANIVRGRFDLIGKRFQFSDSSIRLAPELGTSRLDISATHETRDDILAILNVDGTIDRPEISLTSDPILPEDEVLSRVLFGRSPTQLSGLEAARLAAALAQLSGGGGFDLMGGVERALGLDTFDLGSGNDGDVQVTSGKYLTENVYLEVRSGATAAPGVAIEWEPVSNIEVEAATSTDDGQQFSIQWKRDFDDGVFPGIAGNRTGSASAPSAGQPDADPGIVDNADEEDFGTASDTAVEDGAAPVDE
ncbi:MAG: translocation/assembly module TamB domain-containing protein [Henriciella sp.]|uniref:translocation/assembly module TamB domain-containing protein n=1 Tax=Henriciella sp. TaxID=1968823 RepID=UPI0032EEC749